jgi:hypothetical protein
LLYGFGEFLELGVADFLAAGRSWQGIHPSACLTQQWFGIETHLLLLIWETASDAIVE